MSELEAERDKLKAELAALKEEQERINVYLGVALHKLGGSMGIVKDDLLAIDGMLAAHGHAPDGVLVVRLEPAVSEAELEAQALAAERKDH